MPTGTQFVEVNLSWEPPIRLASEKEPQPQGVKKRKKSDPHSLVSYGLVLKKLKSDTSR